MRPELLGAITKFYKVNDLENYDEVMRGVGFFVHLFGRIHRLESHNEHWLENDARLRLDFNIPGLKPESMEPIKKKSGMKKKFQEAGLRVARGSKASTREQALRFAAEVGYPIVAKPDKGVGAQATYKIEKEEDFAQVTFESGYFLEEFICGKIVTFDGLVDGTGELVFFTSHEYSQGIMEVAAMDTHVNYYSMREIHEDLESAGRKIIKAFDLRERFFHFEFFRTKEEKLLPNGEKSSLVCLEVNMRPPGGFTTDMFNFANDIDVYSAWARMVTSPNGKLPEPLVYSRPYHVSYTAMKRRIKYKHGPEEIKAHKTANKIVFSGNLPKGLSLMGDYFYMTKSENLQELLDFTQFLWE
jgi:biotin carboxylase